MGSTNIQFELVTCKGRSNSLASQPKEAINTFETRSRTSITSMPQMDKITF